MTCDRCVRHKMQMGAMRHNLRDSTRKAQREAGRHGRPTPERLADIAETKRKLEMARHDHTEHARTCEESK